MERIVVGAHDGPDMFQQSGDKPSALEIGDGVGFANLFMLSVDNLLSIEDGYRSLDSKPISSDSTLSNCTASVVGQLILDEITAMFDDQGHS